MCKWAHYLTTLLVFILLIAIFAFIVLNVLKLQLSRNKALYIESISVLVFIIVAGIGWLCYDTIVHWPFLNGDRAAIEKRLMAESKLRGALHSNTFSRESDAVTDNNSITQSPGTTTNTKSTTAKSRSIKKQGTFEMTITNDEQPTTHIPT